MTHICNNMSRRFTLPVEVDDFGDMSITFPAELMTELGWYEGTEIDILRNSTEVLY